MPDDRFFDDDSFWDVKHLMPKNTSRKTTPPPAKKSSTSSFASDKAPSAHSKTPPASTAATTGEKFPVFSPDKPIKIYRPEIGRIKEVRLYPWPNRYSFFTEFRKNAVSIYKMTADSAPFTPFFSFMPQYHQLTAAQLRYYLFWRESFKKGEYLQTDFSYLLLFAYEVINLPELLPPQEGANTLCKLWMAYRKSYPKLDKYLSEWLCDYCLVNTVRPDPILFAKITRYGRTACSFKEFYITEAESSLPDILSSVYSYKESKYYTEENRVLFDTHIPGAVKVFLTYMASHDPHFTERPAEESIVSRNSYDGAVCVYGEKKRIELSVLLYKPSGNALLITDAVKMAENRLRAHLGVRARLSVPSLTMPMKAVIDAYFEEHLPSARASKKMERDESYLSKYEADSHGFSFEEAKKIENDSIVIAERLGAVYEEEPLSPFEKPMISCEKQTFFPKNIPEISDALPLEHQNITALKTLFSQGHAAFSSFAKEQGILPAALASAINEEALERIGDIVIEETDGKFTTIQDYQEEITQWINN